MLCIYCDSQLPEEIHDTTFSNYDSWRYSKGTHTGNIYKCWQCEHYTIELVQENGQLDVWEY